MIGAVVILILGYLVINVFTGFIKNNVRVNVGQVDKNSPLLILVNEENPLTSDYVPEELVLTEVFSQEDIYLVPEAASALEKLFDDANIEGIELMAISGYRDYATQEVLNAQAIVETGNQVIGFENIEAGKSEHQTGLAVDVATEDTNFNLRQDFSLTKGGKWIAENAANYGFIIRYPQGKESSTGNIYEPWHLRYVGINNARNIINNNLSLEEYLDI